MLFESGRIGPAIVRRRRLFRWKPGQRGIGGLAWMRRERFSTSTPPGGALFIPGLTKPWASGPGLLGAREALIGRPGGAAPARASSLDPGLPVARSWIHEIHQNPVMTYEAGDETPADQVRKVARIAAEETMRRLIDGPNSHTEQLE